MLKKVSKGSDYVEYIYLANGEKLAKKKNGQFVNFYCGSFVYKGDKSLEYIAHSEGLALKDGSSFSYQYNLTDHLGNVRNVLNANNVSVQSNDYYPFGLTHNAVSNLAKNKYLYNGKEAQDELIGGTIYNVLDYHARSYDPVIGRMHEPDPMQEKYFDFSSYTYCINNPMKYIDPTGEDIVIVGDSQYQSLIMIYLHALYNSGDAGKYLVSEAINSKKTFTIINAKHNDAEIGEMEGGNITTLTYNLDDRHGKYGEKDGGVEFNPLTQLGHEIAHFLNPQAGLLVDNNGESLEMSAGEVQAVEWENRVRADLGMEERKLYDGVDVYGKGIKKSNKSAGNYELTPNKEYGQKAYSVKDYGRYERTWEKPGIKYSNNKGFIIRKYARKEYQSRLRYPKK